MRVPQDSHTCICRYPTLVELVERFSGISLCPWLMAASLERKRKTALFDETRDLHRTVPSASLIFASWVDAATWWQAVDWTHSTPSSGESLWFLILITFFLKCWWDSDKFFFPKAYYYCCYFFSRRLLFILQQQRSTEYRIYRIGRSTFLQLVHVVHSTKMFTAVHQRFAFHRLLMSCPSKSTGTRIPTSANNRRGARQPYLIFFFFL